MALTGRAPQCKNKGQLRRVTPADELAGKCAAAQRTADAGFNTQTQDSSGGKEKERRGGGEASAAVSHVWARQWETNTDDGGDSTQPLGAETQANLMTGSKR